MVLSCIHGVAAILLAPKNRHLAPSGNTATLTAPKELSRSLPRAFSAAGIQVEWWWWLAEGWTCVPMLSIICCVFYMLIHML